MQRWIIHIDMDAFFAAVEQRDNPDLWGKPVIIGGVSGRGVVSTASYEARRFGVRSAMPTVEARRRCPEGIFLPGDHAKYSRVSKELRLIFCDFSPLVETLSLDEAFLDVSGMLWLYPDPVEIARKIKECIKQELGLTASAGIAPNKFLAKMASDMQKPDGLVVIRHGQEAATIRDISVNRLWGVGESTDKALERLGIRTIGQLAQYDADILERYLGKAAQELHCLAHGRDERPVIPDQEPKSIGKEETFETDLTDGEEIRAHILDLVGKVGWRLRKSGYVGRTVTVKIRFKSFRTITRSRTLGEPVRSDDIIYETALRILDSTPLTEGVRLLGITVSNLMRGSGQTSLFSDENAKKLKVCETVDKLKDRFGEAVITRGRLLDKG